MSYDLIVRGGDVVLEHHGVSRCDIGIREGRFAAILTPGDGVAEHEIDARGRVVFPGIVDAHVHFGLGSEEDWATESTSASLGGVTTALSYLQDARSYLEAVPEDRAQGERTSVIDFGIHPILMNDQHLLEIGRYVRELGVTSFKYFTNFKGDEGAYMGVAGTDTGFFFDLCREVAKFPEAILAVHTESIELIWRTLPKVKQSGRDGLRAWNEARPDLAEAIDLATALKLAEATGCRMYVPHVSSAVALDVFREHRARGGSAILETCTHYLMLTEDSSCGTIAKVNPPIRREDDREALWRAVADGEISVVASDHNSRPRSRKEGTIWEAAAGFAGVFTLLPLMLHEGHHRRGLSLNRIADVLAHNPARVFGLYPRKGCIAVGADADLTIVDLDATRTVDSAQAGSHTDFSVYDGVALQGWPERTIVRGATVMEDGSAIDSQGQGHFIERPARESLAEHVDNEASHG